jgi:hypothetical protein
MLLQPFFGEHAVKGRTIGTQAASHGGN